VVSTSSSRPRSQLATNQPCSSYASNVQAKYKFVAGQSRNGVNKFFGHNTYAANAPNPSAFVGLSSQARASLKKDSAESYTFSPMKKRVLS